MEEFIEYYEDIDVVNNILHSNEYIKFTVNECTVNALNKKADFINKCYNNMWLPLCIKYHPTVRVYDKVFYVKK